MTTEIQLYDTVEAIAAEHERRKVELERVTVLAAECQVELKKDYLTEHKQCSWRNILDKSNARQWMSTKQSHDVTAMLFDTPEKLPEITVETLRSWLQDLIVGSPDMLRDLCREAFEFLTPQVRSGQYKSNENKREIPQSGRVVLQWMCQQDKWETSPHLRYDSGQRLDVLDRIFSLLDKRAKPEGDVTTYHLCQAASRRGETEVSIFWGTLKMHKNGNLHIWLTRPDLLKKLTEISAGNNMRAAEAA